MTYPFNRACEQKRAYRSTREMAIQPLIRILKERREVSEHELRGRLPVPISLVLRHVVCQGRHFQLLSEEIGLV